MNTPHAPSIKSWPKLMASALFTLALWSMGCSPSPPESPPAEEITVMPTGRTVTRIMQVGDEYSFKDGGATLIGVTLIRVDECDPDDDRDDLVGLIIDTPTTSEERWIEELHPEIIGGVRIHIVMADAVGGGRAEVELTRVGEDDPGATAPH